MSKSLFGCLLVYISCPSSNSVCCLRYMCIHLCSFLAGILRYRKVYVFPFIPFATQNTTIHGFIRSGSRFRFIWERTSEIVRLLPFFFFLLSAKALCNLECTALLKGHAYPVTLVNIYSWVPNPADGKPPFGEKTTIVHKHFSYWLIGFKRCPFLLLSATVTYMYNNDRQHRLTHMYNYDRQHRLTYMHM